MVTGAQEIGKGAFIGTLEGVCAYSIDIATGTAV